MKQNVNDVLKFRQGREEGRLEGRLEGLEEGAYEKAVEVARSMLKDNLPLEMIAKHAKLDMSELIEMQKE